MSKTMKVISVIMMVVLVMAMSTVAISAITCDAPAGVTVTYTVDVTAARLFEDVQASVAYDANALELVRILSDDPDVADWEVEGPARCPNLDGVIFNAGTEGVVKFNASKVAGFNFKTAATLVTLEFVVKTAGSNIDLTIDEMTIKGGESSYFTGGAASVTEGIEVVETLTWDEPVTTEPATTAPATTAPATTAPATTAPVTEPITTAPATTAPATTEATEPATTVPAPVATDATGATEAPATEKVDAPVTGAATYIYVAIAMMAMAACAVVVLRKKANG